MPFGDKDLCQHWFWYWLLPAGTKPLPEVILTYHQMCVLIAISQEVLMILIHNIGYTFEMDPSYQSQNALDKYPTMHHYVTEMCRTCTEWCNMGYLSIGYYYHTSHGPMSELTLGQTYGASHHDDVIMRAIASLITDVSIVYATVRSGADQRKNQSSSSRAFVRGIHRWTVNSRHKGRLNRNCFHFMTSS